MSDNSVYIIEDDQTLRDELASLLELNGFEAHICNDFSEAARTAVEQDYDCILLDLTLPESNGHAICREIRKSSDVPIIVLTSAGDEFQEVMALNLGADDFVLKPYRPAALLARMKSIISRKEGSSAHPSTVEHAGVILDMHNCTVSYGGDEAQLTRNEQRILSMLMENAGAIVSRQEIMCDLWESDEFIDDNTLTVNINRLRKTLSKIGVPEDFLLTRRALGYIIE